MLPLVEAGGRAGAETLYGSDKHGLVWGYLFEPDTPARAIDAEEAAAALATGSGEGRAVPFVWLHFSTANAATERFLSESLSLPDSFHEALRDTSRSTRVERDGDSLLAVFHDVLFDLGGSESGVSTVVLDVEPRMMVTARPRPLKSLDRLRASVRSGETFRSTAELLAHLLRDQADVLLELVRKSTARVDDVEDGLLENRLSFSRAELGSLRRQLVRLQRLLAPEPAALFRLLSRPPSWVGEDDQNDLRQAAEEFSAVVADSVALVERLKLLQEELAALVNEQNNKSLFLLTVVTVLALPFTVIGGLFGMNVGGIPFSDHTHGFAMVVALVVSFTAMAGVLALRNRRD
jgi:zinc transporter